MYEWAQEAVAGFLRTVDDVVVRFLNFSLLRRPEQCRKHEFPFRDCPIGIEKLKIADSIAISLRIDEGWGISKLL